MKSGPRAHGLGEGPGFEAQDQGPGSGARARARGQSPKKSVEVLNKLEETGFGLLYVSENKGFGNYRNTHFGEGRRRR